MKPEKWEKIKSLFEVAADLSGKERAEFLDNKCEGDSELRAEVEKLLNSFEEADTSFLEEPAEKEVVSQLLEQKTQALKNQTTSEAKPEAFIAGTVLDERYRIIGLLGKGGMGEVYKAEDLKLNQMVALKFLPEKLERNEDALKRFIGEVRTARQVSHQNVCTVYDIGDIGGKHFLSMEFIEGDDLSQLLKRIGRLPSERAAEISRQICFGLHAIHEAGILHRDLKPANIIIDSKGKARITDFGIAGIEEEINSEEIRVGTPAYMSPEQVAGKEVTPRSDIYSLGLLLYEIYTGKQAIEADSFEELLEKQKTTQPTNPSNFVENIEPIVEKTINRCLEKSPADRPKTALQVALALPGGSPLEAAIAAGETPSPEMVAAAPKKGALKLPVAISLLAGLLILFFSLIYIYEDFKTDRLTPFEKSPEILAEKSREFLKKVGFDETPTDSDYQFVQDASFIKYHTFYKTEKNADLPSRKEMLRKSVANDFFFLYRQSPSELEPVDSVFVTENEPPLDVSNMTNIKLDPNGRLREFVSVPNQTVSTENKQGVDWKVFFDEAGLDFNKFETAKSEWTPPVFADTRQAWKGSLADFPSVPIRIETAEFSGKPVYFKVVNVWDLPEREAEADQSGNWKNQSVYWKYGTMFIIAMFCIAILGSMFFAFRNLRAGRGDLRGGLKLITFVFSAVLISQIIIADHVPTIWGELSIIYEATSIAIILAIFTGLLYIALEPFVRRYWSETLISWNRVMKGDFRDPMVGRDILGGSLCGAGHVTAIFLGHIIVQSYLGNYEFVNGTISIQSLNGTSGLIAFVLDHMADSILTGLILLFLAFLFYRLTGNKFFGALSIGILALIGQSLFFILNIHPLVALVSIIVSACYVISLWKFGLLGLVSNQFFFILIYVVPYTFDTSVFYFPTSVLATILVLGLAVYSFYISIAGQSILSSNVLKKIEE